MEYYGKEVGKDEEKWEFVYVDLSKLVDGKWRFEEIEMEVCKKFGEYVVSGKKVRGKGGMRGKWG